MCEKAVFVKVSNLYYITLPIKDFWKRLAREFGVLRFQLAGDLHGTMHRLTKWRFELNYYCGGDESSSLGLHDSVLRVHAFSTSLGNPGNGHLTVCSETVWRFVSNSLRN